MNEEEGALLGNDIRVLIAELNSKLARAAKLGIDVTVEPNRAWVLNSPALQTSLQVKIQTEIR